MKFAARRLIAQLFLPIYTLRHTIASHDEDPTFAAKIDGFREEFAASSLSNKMAEANDGVWQGNVTQFTTMIIIMELSNYPVALRRVLRHNSLRFCRSLLRRRISNFNDACMHLNLESSFKLLKC
jgi:hypothetical protein